MSALAEALIRAGLADTASLPEPDVQPVHNVTEVIERRLLWDHGIILFPVPNAGKVATHHDPTAGTFEYFQFLVQVADGMISCHVRDEKPGRWAGKKLRAQVHLCWKQLKNGAGYFYLDLFPTQEAPTHALRFVNKDHHGALPDWCRNAGNIIFEPSSPPLKTAVVFVPIS